MIENINQNTKQTKSTLKILGMAYINALTTIRMPCHLEMARKGRSALNVLNDLNTLRFSFSSISRLKTDTCRVKFRISFWLRNAEDAQLVIYVSQL